MFLALVRPASSLRAAYSTTKAVPTSPHLHLMQALLGALEGESQAVQVIQAAAGGSSLTPQRYRDILPNHLPIPVGQFRYTDRGWRLLHHPFQLLLLRLVKGGGEPPVCSKIKAAGPPSHGRRRPTVR